MPHFHFSMTPSGSNLRMLGWVKRYPIQFVNVSGRQVAHCVMAISIALAGGALAQAFFSRRDDGMDRVDAPAGV